LKKLIVVLSIFLIVFTIGAVVITSVNIEAKKQVAYEQKEVIKVSEIDEVVSDIEPNDKIETGIDLYGTYNQNDLIINEIIEKYKGVKVEIPQIEGLKDKNIENKINQDIYNRIYEGLRKQTEVEAAYFIEGANFANVLSVPYYIKSDDGYSNVSLNYNLVNGEKLTLEDLFTKGTDVKDLIRKSFYEAIIKEMRYSEEYSKLYNDVYDELEVIISPDENEVFNVVNRYLSSKEYVFSFNPSKIYLYYGDYNATIKMVDNADKISIYTKYLTDESIFAQNDIGFKNIFNCANGNSYDDFDHIEYGYLEDNLWYDISNAFCDLPDVTDEERIDKFIKFKEGIYDSVYTKISEYREVARNNSDKFYIIISKPSLWVDDETDFVEVNVDTEIYEMKMSVYNTVYKDKLIDAYRYPAFISEGGVNLYLEENDEVIFTEIKSEKIYNYITGEEITNVQN